ncbi:MAG: hypothetical protein HYV23_07520 [Deltaproteobacteria bacterium]|nr:hypothetical protein [Deltaproteobacteria bacterium]
MKGLIAALICFAIAGVVLSFFPSEIVNIYKKENFFIKNLWFKHYKEYFFDHSNKGTIIKQFRTVGIIFCLIVLVVILIGFSEGGIFTSK